MSWGWEEKGKEDFVYFVVVPARKFAVGPSSVQNRFVKRRSA